MECKNVLYVRNTADDIGVNITQMKADMESDTVAKAIADDQALADSHNFKGTPSFLVGSKGIVGSRPYSVIKKIIEKQLGH